MLPFKTGFLIQVGIPHVRTQIYQYRNIFNSLHIRSFKNLSTLKEPSAALSICKWADNLEQIVILIKTSQCFDKSWNTRTLQTLLQKTIMVGTAAVGSDHIDFNFIKKKSIRFINTPGCNRFAVRDYVLMVLLKYALFIQKPLKDFHVGILGCGNVGAEVSKAVIALGGKISIFDPYLTKNKIIKKIKENTLTINRLRSSITICSTFDELIYSHDLTAVTLHVPLTQKSIINKYPTYHLLNQKVFNKLTKLSTHSDSPLLLINSSRGGIVYEKNLLPYLTCSSNPNAKHRTGVFYATDVWEQEPILNPEVVVKSFFATPHIAGYSLVAKQFAAQDLIKKAIHMLMLKQNKKNTEFKTNIKTKLILSPSLVGQYKKEKLIYENILLKLVARLTGLDAFHCTLQGSSWQSSWQSGDKKKDALTLSKQFLALRKKPLRKELREVELLLPSKSSFKKINARETKAVMLEIIKLWKRVFNKKS